MSIKIAFVNKHTHNAQFLYDINGKAYLFETVQDAQKQLECLALPKCENGEYSIIVSYDHNDGSVYSLPLRQIYK